MEGSRSRARLAMVVLAAMIAALTAFIVLSAVLIGRFSVGHVWSAAGLFVIIMVTAMVGLVVVRHQPGNPIGWLLAGTAIFMLANIAAGSYAQLVYDQGYHALSFGGLPRGRGLRRARHLGGQHQLLDLGSADPRVRGPAAEHRHTQVPASCTAPWNLPTSPSGSPPRD
jgi:hypothetical protein